MTFIGINIGLKVIPTFSTAIAEEMVKLLPTECDGLAGLELGGIPLATAISLQTGHSLFLCS